MPTNTSQARYWILTIPHQSFLPYLPPSVNFIKGQLELGAAGFLHWQVIAGFKAKVRLRAVRTIFGDSHAEPTKSEAAEDYVWKEDTRVEGTQFLLGSKPFQRANPVDWAVVAANARAGDLERIRADCPDVYVRNYASLRRIGYDNLQPAPMERIINVYWGPTGTGKSRRAWDEASFAAYPKDPRTKFWDGYQGHAHVVIDEFRGDIDIAHLLRWFDRYPVNVEVKGSAITLRATTIWITSNLDPRQWFPSVDGATMAALMRRLTVVHFNEPI